MKRDLEMNFEDFPLNVPSEKRITNKLDVLLQDLVECGSALTANLAIKHWNKYMTQINTDAAVIYVRYSCDTRNPVYKRAQARVDEISPIISNYSNKFAKILVKARYRKDLEKKYGKYYFQMMDASLKAFDEKIIPELIQENKLVSEYDSLLGGAEIKFRGEVLNLSQLGKYLQDVDRETRKEAAQAMDKWMSEHEEKLGQIYDDLVHLRDKMAKKLGYKNFVDLGYLRLGRTDYNAKDVKKYREQIAETVVPVAQKLYKKQMKDLGIKDPQYYDYNLKFKTGNPKPIGGVDELVKVAHEMYSDLGSESKEFFEFMMKHNLMDLDARKGKAPGGYCTSLTAYNAPFIFSNFNGTDGDVNVLCHEGGHALQAYLSFPIKIPEYQNPTLEACEIHSMSMEFFAWPYMEKFFGKDANKYRYLHLADAIEFLPYGITVDEFQHWVYEHPNATHQERCAYWRSLEEKYTPHKKYDDTPTLGHGAYWLRQSHIFANPFYYIDYTLAQVCAFQFFIEMRKNHEKAWKKYIKLCKFGGQAPFVSLLEHNHLRNPFVDGNVAKVIHPLEKVLKEFDTSKF